MHTLNTDYLFALFELIEEMGHSPINLCQSLGVIIPESGNIGIDRFAALLEELERKHGITQPGLLIGMHMGLSQHGFLGYAAKSSETIADALKMDEQYIATRISSLQFSTDVDGDTCRIHISAPEALNPYMPFISELVFSSLIAFFREIFPNTKIEAHISASYAAPDNLEIYRKFSPVSWKFDQDSNYLEIPTAWLSLKLPTYDPALKHLSVQQCIQDMEKNQKRWSFTDSVTSILTNNLASPPTVVEVATSLGMNERTLKRRLKNEETSYRDIITNLRLKKAKHLLGHSSLSIDEIAFQLGYASPSTFKRLFKSWTGTTPGSFRK